MRVIIFLLMLCLLEYGAIAQLPPHVITGKCHLDPYTPNRVIQIEVVINGKKRSTLSVDNTGIVSFNGRVPALKGDSTIELHTVVLKPEGYFCLKPNPETYFEGTDAIIQVMSRPSAYNFYKQSGLRARGAANLDSSTTYFAAALEDTAYSSPVQEVDLRRELSRNYYMLGLYSKQLETFRKVGSSSLIALPNDEKARYFSDWTTAYFNNLPRDSATRAPFSHMVLSSQELISQWSYLIDQSVKSGFLRPDTLFVGGVGGLDAAKIDNQFSLLKQFTAPVYQKVNM
jgi:hypothetical protein